MMFFPLCLCLCHSPLLPLRFAVWQSQSQFLGPDEQEPEATRPLDVDDDCASIYICHRKLSRPLSIRIAVVVVAAAVVIEEACELRR